MGEIKDELIPDYVYQNLLSGVGLGAYVLYNRAAGLTCRARRTSSVLSAVCSPVHPASLQAVGWWFANHRSLVDGAIQIVAAHSLQPLSNADTTAFSLAVSQKTSLPLR